MSPREVRLPVAWGELAGLRREATGQGMRWIIQIEMLTEPGAPANSPKST